MTVGYFDVKQIVQKWFIYIGMLIPAGTLGIFTFLPSGKSVHEGCNHLNHGNQVSSKEK